MIESVRLSGSIQPPGLNKMLRMHWAKRKKLYEAIKLELALNYPVLPQFDCPVEIVYTRYYARQAMDWDNAGSSFKLLGDALVELGVIEDDNPRVVVRFEPRQVKTPVAQQGYSVDITALD